MSGKLKQALLKLSEISVDFFTKIVNSSKSMMDVMRNFGFDEHEIKRHRNVLTRKIKEKMNDMQMKVEFAERMLPVQQLRKRRRNGRTLKRKLLKSGVEYSCKICKCANYKRGIFGYFKKNWYWNGAILKLQVDHINGKHDCDEDDDLENLRFVCPNCHTQTPTFAKNKTTRVKRTRTEEQNANSV